MTAEIVSLPLGPRAYNIHIGEGLLEEAGPLLAPLLPRLRTVVVTDENVFAAQGARLAAGLEKAAIEADFIKLAPGEATKSFSELEKLTGQLLDLGIERNDLIIAFGGGVIGDLAGFASAILRRGCRIAQLPTSLLAQADSAVGGKTAINALQGKNLIGAFHQPAIVLADITALETLPARELRAGYAEIVKYGLIADRVFFEWLEANGEKLLSKSGASERIYAVKKSCAAKAAIVSEDEREKGARALLNLGHTFGHALEGAFGFSDALLHGEAIAAGMALAFDFSVRQGRCKIEESARLRAHLKKCRLPASISDLPPSDNLAPEALMKLMMQDKKVEAGKLTLVLAGAIGEAMIVKDTDASEIMEFLKDATAR